MIDGNQVYFQGILNFGTLDARGLLARQQRGASERVALVGERPLGADPITLPFISPESRFDPWNLIGRLEKRFLKGPLLGTLRYPGRGPGRQQPEVNSQGLNSNLHKCHAT